MEVNLAISAIESARDMKVLFVGDTIIDEYVYVRPLGKSPKEYIIPMRYEDSEEFHGGVEAAANHARSFCASVEVCTRGEGVRKTRFVDRVQMRKVGEIHYPGPVTGGLDPKLDGYDAVVVTDFGHGAVRGDKAIELFKHSKFLAVNAQTNSANIGFNLITKYPRADYIVIDEQEARLAASDRDSSIEAVILKLAEGRCSRFVVTLGHMGAVGWDGSNFHYCGSFEKRPIDSMGAGDAFFAVTAPIAKHAGMKELLRIGNAAGAIKTQIVGHRESVTKEAVIDYLRRAG